MTQTFLTLRLNIQLSNASVWIGGTGIATERHFAWATSGNPMNYTNWYQDYPRNDTGKNCMSMFGDFRQWTNDLCDWGWGPIYCEVVFYC